MADHHSVLGQGLAATGMPNPGCQPEKVLTVSCRPDYFQKEALRRERRRAFSLWNRISRYRGGRRIRTFEDSPIWLVVIAILVTETFSINSSDSRAGGIDSTPRTGRFDSSGVSVERSQAAGSWPRWSISHKKRTDSRASFSSVWAIPRPRFALGYGSTKTGIPKGTSRGFQRGLRYITT